MRYGIREICDVVLRAKSTMKLGDKVFYKDEPVIRFDTLKTSSLEGAATSVYAQGGRGNARLVAWEGERTLTFTMEDALLTPESFAILSGARMKETKINKLNQFYLKPIQIFPDQNLQNYNNIYLGNAGASLSLGDYSIPINKFMENMPEIKNEEQFEVIFNSFRLTAFKDDINLLDSFWRPNNESPLAYQQDSIIYYAIEGDSEYLELHTFDDYQVFIQHYENNEIKDIDVVFNIDSLSDNYEFATSFVNFWNGLDASDCQIYLEADPYGVLKNKKILVNTTQENITYELSQLEITDVTFKNIHWSADNKACFVDIEVEPNKYPEGLRYGYVVYTFKSDNKLASQFIFDYLEFLPEDAITIGCGLIISEYSIHPEGVLNFNTEPLYMTFAIRLQYEGETYQFTELEKENIEEGFYTYGIDSLLIKTPFIDMTTQLKQVFKPALPYYDKGTDYSSNPSANLVHRTQILHFNGVPRWRPHPITVIRDDILSKIPTIDKATAYIMKLDANNEIDTEPYPIFNDNVSLNAWSWREGGYYLLDYYEAVEKVKTLTIEPDHFSSNFYLEASTLFRDTRGTDHPAEFVIPNCKVQSNFTLSMASSGDPSTFTFTLDAFPGYARFNPGKKVLASVQLLDNVNLNDLKRDRTSHNPAHEGLITF